MFLSRVRIKLCEDSLKYLEALVKNDGYATHQLLWSLFPQDSSAERDFLFRVEQQEGWPLYYVLSKRRPEISLPMFSVETRAFDPVITAGLRLGFDVRANPVVARKVEGKKNSKHHDVWMDAKHEAKVNNLTQEKTEILKIEYTKKWLVDRSERCGFKIENEKVQIDSYCQHRALKKGVAALHYSTVDYKGVLNVTDVAKFKETLEKGIGRSKAFGCGLLLIKPL